MFFWYYPGLAVIAAGLVMMAVSKREPGFAWMPESPGPVGIYGFLLLVLALFYLAGGALARALP